VNDHNNHRPSQVSPRFSLGSRQIVSPSPFLRATLSRDEAQGRKISDGMPPKLPPSLAVGTGSLEVLSIPSRWPDTKQPSNHNIIGIRASVVFLFIAWKTESVFSPRAALPVVQNDIWIADRFVCSPPAPIYAFRPVDGERTRQNHFVAESMRYTKKS
jgi:hypothetical protein